MAFAVRDSTAYNVPIKSINVLYYPIFEPLVVLVAVFAKRLLRAYSLDVISVGLQCSIR